MRTLWVGGSNSYVHDLPLQTVQAVSDAGARTLTADLAGRAQGDLHAFLRAGFSSYQYGVPKGQSLLDRILDGRYDRVVLDVNPVLAAGKEGAEYLAAVATLCKAARNSGGEPVFFEAGHASSEAGRKQILVAARNLGVTRYAPCARALQLARKEKPGLALANPDDPAEPSLSGLFLNVCCLSAALLGKEPERMPRTLRVWRPVKDERRGEIEGRLQGSPPESPYLRALPLWLQVNSEAAESETLDEPTATFLQRIARDALQETRSAHAP